MDSSCHALFTTSWPPGWSFPTREHREIRLLRRLSKSSPLPPSGSPIYYRIRPLSLVRRVPKPTKLVRTIGNDHGLEQRDPTLQKLGSQDHIQPDTAITTGSKIQRSIHPDKRSKRSSVLILIAAKELADCFIDVKVRRIRQFITHIITIYTLIYSCIINRDSKTVGS